MTAGEIVLSYFAAALCGALLIVDHARHTARREADSQAGRIESLKEVNKALHAKCRRMEGRG